jgi:hypothetical protein
MKATISHLWIVYTRILTLTHPKIHTSLTSDIVAVDTPNELTSVSRSRKFFVSRNATFFARLRGYFNILAMHKSVTLSCVCFAVIVPLL